MSGISQDIQALLNAPTAQDYQAKEISNQYNSNVVNAQEQQAKMQQAAFQRQQVMQAIGQKALVNYLQNPSDPHAFAAASALNPDMQKGIKDGFDASDAATKQQMLIDSADLHSYAQSGNYKSAQELMQRSIDADTKAGVDTSQDQHILDLAKSAQDGDEAAANELKGWAQMHLFAIGDADTKKNLADQLKVNSTIANNEQDTVLKATQAQKNTSDIARQEALLPSDIQGAQADARLKSVQADVLPDATAADIAYKLSQTALNKDQLGRVPDALLPKVLEISDAGKAAKGLSDQFSNLADQIEQNKGSMGGGIFASGVGVLTHLTGDQNSITQLREQYKALRAQLAFTKLPPGSSSDQDVKFALSGFPPDNASADTLTKFLRGAAKLQQYTADYNDAKAQFMTANRGDPTRAKGPIFIGSDLVPAGTSFDQYMNDKYAAQKKADAKAKITQGK